MMAHLLPREHTGEVALHALPVVMGPIVGHAISSLPAGPSAEDFAALRKQAYANAYAQATRDAARDIAERKRRLQQVCDTLARPLENIDEEVVERVGELAVIIARHIVRRELKTNPGEVIGVVREAMRQLPMATRRARIHLHPDDLGLVQNALHLGTDVGWQLEADPLLTRGGCVVETESSRIDAQVESRISAIASKMFGGERESDHAR